MTIVVSNATPLIALARIGRFDLLHDVCGEILITDAVVGEIEAGGEGAPGREEVRRALAAGWLEERAVGCSRELAGLSVDLDIGEATTIMLAVDLGAALVLLDERKAQARARALGLNVVGTIGTLLLAKRRGLMPDLERSVERLQQEGFHIGPELLDSLLSGNG